MSVCGCVAKSCYRKTSILRDGSVNGGKGDGVEVVALDGCRGKVVEASIIIVRVENNSVGSLRAHWQSFFFLLFL